MVMIVMVMVFAVHHSVHLLGDMLYLLFGLLAGSSSHRAMVIVPRTNAHTRLCPLPPLARYGRNDPPPSRKGRMGKHQERTVGDRFGHPSITGSAHRDGITTRIHPLGVLHLTGIMEQVAEIIETLARGANPNNRMARCLTRSGNHSDTRHDLTFVVDHLQEPELLDRPNHAREGLVRLRLTPIPVALCDQVTCVRIACDRMVITQRCHPSEV